MCVLHSFLISSYNSLYAPKIWHNISRSYFPRDSSNSFKVLIWIQVRNNVLTKVRYNVTSKSYLSFLELLKAKYDLLSGTIHVCICSFPRRETY